VVLEDRMSIMRGIDTINEQNIKRESLEAIKFQTNSKLPAELEDLIQQVMDFGIEHDQLHGAVTNNDQAMRKHTKMRTYIQKEIGPQIAQVIKKNTGIVVTKFHSDLPIDLGSSMALYVYFKNFDEAMSDLLLASQAFADAELNKKKQNKMSDLFKISESLDRFKGTIGISVKQFEVIIGLPVGLFCMADFVKDGSKYQPTSAEITAGLLHEIGHVFAYIEYLGDLCYTGYYGNNPIRDIEERLEKDPQKTIGEVASLLETVEKSEANATLTKMASSVKTMLLGLQNKSITPQDKDTGTKLEKTAYRLITIHAACLVIIRLGIAIIMAAYIIPIYFGTGLMTSLIYFNAKGAKTADRAKRLTMYERLADEYVSRHKMSIHLNRLLTKIFGACNAMENGYGMVMFNEQLRESFLLRTTAFTLSLPFHLLNGVLGRLTAPLSNYESDMVRLKRNINNMHDNLKDTSIPKELRLEILNDIASMEKDFRANSTVLGRGLDKLLTFIVTAPYNVISQPLNLVFGDANLVTEYGKLFEQLDQMMSNKSFYHSEKIKHLLK